ncbi:hypothetical protein, conserved [Trypanosoma brucei gambiense DAL972]|uniref:Uncharacterized protein n=2 Tax=Trypanosoma brucei TaxID=5691 RepID=C9ZTT4_TRYB9|nr:hypothetical protein, conserved [Trypanosoma brucei gambiense DAL972]RHW71374.1 hypothetical protein DPX39_070071900 [Trypanosoma brucei equiperdum]CBH12820.1 hypothetical protein, conserved [Trypanosoma brucei gambiense DAL972]|eukprot:XP_011775099.1 hypothetical protein, conserved [Trypanosoma brucei gambiense DAL972]
MYSVHWEEDGIASCFASLFSTASYAAYMPTLQYFLKKRYVYESVFAIFGITASLMFHLCNLLGVEIFMDDAAWFRVGNICLITLIGAWSTYICAFRDSFVERFTKYCFLLICIICHATGPWTPVKLLTKGAYVSFLVPICVYTYRRQLPAVFTRRLLVLVFAVVIALSFLFISLDDERDPFMFFLSACRSLFGIASYLMWTLLKVPGVTGVMGKSIHV